MCNSITNKLLFVILSLSGITQQSHAMYLYEYEAETLKLEQLKQEKKESQIKVLDDKKSDFSLSINAQDNWGDTELHRAVRNESEKSVQKLLEEKNVDIDIQNKSGYTPLHIAVKKGNPILVSMLLKKGAKTNTKNNKGHTPLHTAAYYEYEALFGAYLDPADEITNLLLEAGAYWNEKNENNETPYDMIKKYMPSKREESRYFYVFLRLNPQYQLLVQKQKQHSGICSILNEKNLRVIGEVRKRADGASNRKKKYDNIGALYCDLVHKNTCGLHCNLDHRIIKTDTSPRLDLMFYLITKEKWTIEKAFKISTGEINRQKNALNEQASMNNFKNFLDFNIAYK